MPTKTTPINFSRLIELADKAASRFCGRYRATPFDKQDVRQDLLLDFLARTKNFDPARSSLPVFASVCFQHRLARLVASMHCGSWSHHAISLDAAVPGTSSLKLGETLDEADGYSAWMGQRTDEFATLERRLDLDRALSNLPRDALPICAALMLDEPDPAASAGLSRSTFYRRVHDLRCHLLAAGVSGQRGTDCRVAG